MCSSDLIYFYECAKTPRCRSIQFTAGFAGSPIGDARVAEWNRTKRFGRAYLDKDGDPWVEMDVDAERGMTTEGLANQFDRWNAVMGSFMRYIGR